VDAPPRKGDWNKSNFCFNESVGVLIRVEDLAVETLYNEMFLKLSRVNPMSKSISSERLDRAICVFRLVFHDARSAIAVSTAYTKRSIVIEPNGTSVCTVVTVISIIPIYNTSRHIVGCCSANRRPYFHPQLLFSPT